MVHGYFDSEKLLCPEMVQQENYLTAKQTSMFDEVTDEDGNVRILGMARRPDHDTSIQAAGKVEKKRTALQNMIVDALRHFGPMTDGELENLPAFKKYAPSTVRKRRSELWDDGRGILVTVGNRNGMTVWKLCEGSGETT